MGLLHIHLEQSPGNHIIIAFLGKEMIATSRHVYHRERLIWAHPLAEGILPPDVMVARREGPVLTARCQQECCFILVFLVLFFRDDRE